MQCCLPVGWVKQTTGVSTTQGKGIMKRTVYLSGNTLNEPGKDKSSDNSGDGDGDAKKTKKEDGKAAVKEPAWKQPEIGDVRVRWQMITPQVVSIIGMHGGDGVLEPWLGPKPAKITAERSQESVFLLRSGSLGISSLVATAMDRNAGEATEQRMFGFGTMTMGSFLYCHFMQYTTDYADVIAYVRRPSIWLADACALT
jgi:hypothetical protein